MGYFSNGTEGLIYQENYCMCCVHNGPEDGPGCPIWLLHLMHNYEKDMKPTLDLFIPRNDNCGNGECVMFVSLPDTDNLTVDMFTEDKQ
jgi:hypothetical protein